MSGRQGGKKKPLKAPKKDKQMDDDDIELKKKLQADKKAMEEAKKTASQKGPMTGLGKKK